MASDPVAEALQSAAEVDEHWLEGSPQARAWIMRDTAAAIARFLEDVAQRGGRAGWDSYFTSQLRGMGAAVQRAGLQGERPKETQA